MRFLIQRCQIYIKEWLRKRPKYNFWKNAENSRGFSYACCPCCGNPKMKTLLFGSYEQFYTEFCEFCNHSDDEADVILF